MTRRRKILWLFVLAVVAAIIAVVLHDRFVRGPDYLGAPLNVWLRLLDETETPATRDKARDAIRHLGPAALPLTTEWLDWKDSLLRRALNGWVAGDEQHLNFHPLAPKERRQLALRACAALGSNAAPAIPNLLALATAPNPELDAPFIIACIGGSNAPPALNQALNGTNKFIRAGAGVSQELLRDHSDLLKPDLQPEQPPDWDGFSRRLKEYHTQVLNAVTSGRFTNPTNQPAATR